MTLLGAIVRGSLRHRGVVVALACLFTAYAVYVLGRARYDVFPEFAPPEVSINTEAPGLTPEQVEALVTRPVEEAVNGVPGILAMRSNSLQGVSVVTLQFDPALDVHLDRQLVSERLATLAGQLPRGIGPPR